ncbi:hypothetical protein MACH08_19320 [Oceanobacillus kimchii]|uniref:Uncharacterized protein n=2 Tax=Oceanobacillus kimchii TaxID=746691 RepID=A0ABQ5TKJ5_9BACI|nr:hypothetical protein MACH08_19320 [Oceanobacillus kimchii]
MISGGYFIGSNLSSSSLSGVDEIYEENGSIIYNPTDPIYLDDENNVFFNNDNSNAKLYVEEMKVYVERVI